MEWRKYVVPRFDSGWSTLDKGIKNTEIGTDPGSDYHRYLAK